MRSHDRPLQSHSSLFTLPSTTISIDELKENKAPIEDKADKKAKINMLIDNIEKSIQILHTAQYECQELIQRKTRVMPVYTGFGVVGGLISAGAGGLSAINADNDNPATDILAVFSAVMSVFTLVCFVRAVKNYRVRKECLQMNTSFLTRTDRDTVLTTAKELGLHVIEDSSIESVSLNLQFFIPSEPAMSVEQMKEASYQRIEARNICLLGLGLFDRSSKNHSTLRAASLAMDGFADANILDEIAMLTGAIKR